MAYLEAARLVGRRGLESQLNAKVEAARRLFIESTVIDPKIAEAFTALAELDLSFPPGNLDRALEFADKAVSADPKNFGAVRIRSRIYTIKSELNYGAYDAASAKIAIEGWRRLTELDPRNAEAWAFLAEFYRQEKRPEQRLEALRKWHSSTPPAEAGFYSNVMGGKGPDPENAGAELAEALFEAGKTAESLEILREVVGDDPQDQRPVELLAQITRLARPGVAALTVPTLEQLLFSNPDNVELRSMLAGAYQRAGRTSEAISILDRGMQEKSSETKYKLLITKGEILVAERRVDEAIASYRAALAIVNPNDALVGLNKLVGALNLAGRFEEALSVLATFRKSAADESASGVNAATLDLLTSLGRLSEAEILVKELRTKEPKNKDWLRRQATLLAIVGKTDDAVRLIGGERPSSSLSDIVSDAMFLSNLLSNAGLHRESLALLEKTKQDVSKDADMLHFVNLTIAGAEFKAGDSESAIRHLREEIGKRPESPQLQNNLGYFLAETGRDLGEAEALVLSALRIDPENPSYLDSLGWIYFKQARGPALEYLKRSEAISPLSAVTLYHLGECLRSNGDEMAAQRYFEKALKFAGDSRMKELIRYRIKSGLQLKKK